MLIQSGLDSYSSGGHITEDWVIVQAKGPENMPSARSANNLQWALGQLGDGSGWLVWSILDFRVAGDDTIHVTFYRLPTEWNRIHRLANGRGNLTAIDLGKLIMLLDLVTNGRIDFHARARYCPRDSSHWCRHSEGVVGSLFFHFFSLEQNLDMLRRLEKRIAPGGGLKLGLSSPVRPNRESFFPRDWDVLYAPSCWNWNCEGRWPIATHTVIEVILEMFTERS